MLVQTVLMSLTYVNVLLIFGEKCVVPKIGKMGVLLGLWGKRTLLH
jgi:hypothetical protein